MIKLSLVTVPRERLVARRREPRGLSPGTPEGAGTSPSGRPFQYIESVKGSSEYEQCYVAATATTPGVALTGTCSFFARSSQTLLVAS